jgi:hypothetical protein
MSVYQKPRMRVPPFVLCETVQLFFPRDRHGIMYLLAETVDYQTTSILSNCISDLKCRNELASKLDVDSEQLACAARQLALANAIDDPFSPHKDSDDLWLRSLHSRNDLVYVRFRYQANTRKIELRVSLADPESLTMERLVQTDDSLPIVDDFIDVLPTNKVSLDNDILPFVSRAYWDRSFEIMDVPFESADRVLRATFRALGHLASYIHPEDMPRWQLATPMYRKTYPDDVHCEYANMLNAFDWLLLWRSVDAPEASDARQILEAAHTLSLLSDLDSHCEKKDELQSVVGLYLPDFLLARSSIPIQFFWFRKGYIYVRYPFYL